MARAGPSEEEGRRGHLCSLGGGHPSQPPRGGGVPTCLATVGADIVDAMLMRAETLFRPYNSSVEVFASRSKFVFVSDTVCICVRYSLYLPCIQFVFASDTVCICRKYKVYTVAWRNFLR